MSIIPTSHAGRRRWQMHQGRRTLGARLDAARFGLGAPTDLTDEVQKAFDTPCCVSLGSKHAWVIVWPDGYFSWKLYGNYGTLDKILDAGAPPRSVSVCRDTDTSCHIALTFFSILQVISTYNREQYFAAFRDRAVTYSVSPE